MADVTGDGSDRAPGDLKRLTRSGLFDEALEALVQRPEGDVSVRPVIDDLVEGWMPSLVDALDPRIGDLIAVAGDDGRTAARVASDMAAWLADRGRSVTLVDASLNEPVVAKALPEDGDEGVVDVVNFGISADTVRRRTLATRVSLVTSGSYAVSSRDVVSSAAFSQMLGDYASKDIVIVVVSSDLLADAAPAFNAVVVVGATLDGLESNGSRLTDAAATRAMRRVALLAQREAPLPERGAAFREPTEARPATLSGQGDSVPAGVQEGELPEPAMEPTEPEAEPLREEASPEGELPEPAVEPTEPEAEPRRNEEVFVDEEEWYGDEEEPPPLPPPRARGRTGRIVGLVIVAGALAFVVYGMWWAMTGGGMGWMSPRTPADDTEIAVLERTEPDGPGEDVSVPAVDDGAADHAGGADDASGDADAPVENESSATPPDVSQPYGTPVERAEAEPGGEVHAPGQAPVASDGLRRGPGGRFVVLVSSHKHESAALRDAAAFEGATGFESAVAVAEVGETGIWYRVAVAGGFPTLTGAREILDTVKEFGYEGAWIERVATDQ